MTCSTTEDATGGELDPIVVLAADDSFAIPLAVTILSALENLASGRKLRVYVLDGGLSDASKQRLLNSWPRSRCQITWVDVDAAALAMAPISGHANRVNYYRVLTPMLLPPSVRRVIYLDADLLICRDLMDLWQSDLQNHLCLAVQDCAAPCLDATVALANHDLCGRHLGAVTPVANYRQLGLDPCAAYFNSGVLMFDLAAWREADLPRRLLACLDQNKEHVRWWDQYALNVVLAGRWGHLDSRWNQQSHIFAYPTWSQSPYDRVDFDTLRDDPYIVHFTTRYKPWLASCLHPRRKDFFACVDRTDWAGWRPWREHRLKGTFELVRAQERRLRLERRRLLSRAAESIHRWRSRAA